MHSEHEDSECSLIQRVCIPKLSQEKIYDMAAVAARCCEFLGDAPEWFGGKGILLRQFRMLKGMGFAIYPSQAVWTFLMLRRDLNIDLPIWMSASSARVGKITLMATTEPAVAGNAVWREPGCGWGPG